MGWQQQLLGGIAKLSQEANRGDVFQPAKLVSTNPPAIAIAGVTVKKHVKVNPNIPLQDKNDTAMEDAVAEFLEELDKAEEVEDLRGPIRQLLDFFLEREQKNKIKAGDTVMVKQQGNEFYIMNATGG